MINEQDGQKTPEQIAPEALDQAINQAMTDGLRLSYQLSPEEKSMSDGDVGSHEPTPDEVWEYFAGNRTKTFDKTTSEGKRLYELFRIANKDRHEFTMETVKQMGNVIARVPVDIAGGLARNPLKAPVSAIDAVARDIRDLYGILAQSEDPDSVFFRFKDYIKGTGTIEDQIDQFNEARWFNNRSMDLEEGKTDIVSDWVPADYKGFVKNLIDPKLANALSYIGLDIPHMLLSPLKAGRKVALKDSARAYKATGVMGKIAEDEIQKGAIEGISSLTTAFRDTYDTTAKRMKEFSMRTTGTVIAGTADVVAKPFSYVQQKIAQGSTAFAETSGQNATVLRNATQTAIADAGERAIGEGLSLSPIRSTLFSLGVKPLTEYASVLGNEIVDLANGVVQVKPQQIGMGMLERLATKNGSRVPLSAEALAVAKFTNVVVGWPASMAVPVLRRSVGDAAFMGTLGYLNARGEGAAAGIGIGFSWGGLSGSLRHIHNVYSQKSGHAYVISNFDKSQINMIEAKNPETAKHMRATLSAIDGMNDTRIGATIRAAFAQSFTVDPTAQIRFSTRAELIKEFGPEKQITDMPETGLGSQFKIKKNGGELDVIWINKSQASPETIVHEIAHLHLNSLLKNDADSVEIYKQFYGDRKDAGVISDDAMAHLIADYRSKFIGLPDKADGAAYARAVAERKIAYDAHLFMAQEKLKSFRQTQGGSGSMDNVKTDVNGHTIPLAIAEAADGDMNYLKEIVDETFASSYSNSVLNKSPDYFIRNPEYRSLRASLENMYMLRTQRTVAKMEQAGILLRPTNPLNSNAQMTTFMWENGSYLHMPMLDSWTKSVVAQAMRHGDINVSLMSPERAEAYFKQTGKERFANTIKGGKVMKGKREIDQIISENSKKVVDALEALPQNERPRFIISQNGNKSLDMSVLSNKQWDAIINVSVFNAEEVKQLRGLTEMVRNVRAGKPVFNTVTGQYLGRTHQVVIDGQVRRLTGSDVPVTNRHFSPYAVELKFDNFDDFGNPLKEGKGHITVHAVDVRVLNRRRLKMWQRSDVRSMFTDFGHYTRTFANYMDNLSQDASSRKTSAEKFRPEFGSNAEAVRDVMYETFGGRKRADESYVNAPEGGYNGNTDGPNYPFHSLRFELLANLETQPSVFQETFGNNLMALPYNHANAYEGVRRNMMVGGFVEYPIGEDKKYWGNHIGYEIRQNGNRLSLFSPFGSLIGNFKTLARAQSYAERNMRNLPQEEGRGMVGTEQGPTQDSDAGIKVTLQDVSSGRANMMVGNGGYYRADVKVKNNDRWDEFVQAAKDMKFMAAEHSQRSENAFYSQASIKLKDLLGDERLIADYPWMGDFEVVASPLAVLHGGYAEGIWGSRNGRTILALPISHIEGVLGENLGQSLKAVLQGPLQELMAFSEGKVTSNRLAYVDGDIRYIGNSAMLSQMRRMRELLGEQKKLNPNATFEDVLRSEADSNIQGTVSNYWGYDGSNRKVNTLNQHLRNNGLTQGEVKKVESHVIPILDGFLGKNQKNFVVQSLGSTTVFVQPSLLKMPMDVENLLSLPLRQKPTKVFEGAQTYRDIYDAIFRESMSGFHHVSKIGDRTDRTGGTSLLHGVEKASNALANTQPRVFESGRPNMESQTLIGLEGIENYAIFTIGRTSDPTEKGLMPSTSFVTPATSFTVMATSRTTKAGSRATTDMQVFPSKWAPLATLGANRGGINVSINAMMAMNGLSPFLYGEKGDVISRGTLYKHVESGRFSDILEYMYANAFPKEYAELMQRSQGANPFTSHTAVRRIATSTWAKGIMSPEEQAVFHYATYLSQILTGMEMVNGTDFGTSAANLMRNDLIRSDGKSQAVLSDAEFFTDQFLGAGSVNEGVARIVLLAERMGWGVITGGRAFENFVKSRSDDINSARSAAVFVKQMENVGAEIEGIMKDSGFDKAKPLSPVNTYGSPNMMIGGFFGSMDANEKMMEAAGMLRMVRTDGGQMYKAFEFSDKGSSLLLGAVDEKIHLLPFMNDLESPTKGFTSFMADYKTAVDAKDSVAMENIVRKLSTIRLDEILKHDQLYRYYPSLKSVRVGFVEGFGAGYYPKQNFIVLGIDRIISGEIAKANGVDDVIIPDNVRANSIHSSLLHEVQHAIQRMETWTQTGDVTESAQYKRGIFKYLIKNVMGLGGSFPEPLISARTKGSDAIRLEVEKAREAGLDDPEIQKALELSPAEFEKHLMELADSPMAQRVIELAAPSAYQLFGADAMAYERISYELANDATSSRRMAGFAREMMTLQEEAAVIVKEARSGLFTAEQVHMMIYGDGGLLERRDNVSLAIDKSLGKEVSDLSYEYTSHHSRYLDLILDVGRTMDSVKHSTQNGLGFTSVKMRNLVHSLGLMQYYGQLTEKQAYETAERKDMSQGELNKSRRADDYLLKTATDSRANSLKNLGIMMKEGKVPRVSNMMVGGLGMGQSVLRGNSDDYKLDALRKIARLTTISYYVSAADAELQRLNRYVVSARGWEVINGKARLVYKTGIIESANFKRGEMEDSPSGRYGQRVKQSPIYENANDGVDSYLHIYNGLSEDGMNSISLEEVARLIDGTVIMENELATTTEAVDAVYRQDFPARIEMDDLRSVLTSMGVTEEGLQMANISAIQSAFAGATMTKEEIANIMAIHHQFVISEFAYGEAFGKERLTKAINESNPTPELLSQAVIKTWGKSGGERLGQALNSIGIKTDAWTKGEAMRSSFGLFSAGRGAIQFTPVRPDFISEGDWYEWMERKKADGTWPKDKAYIEIGHEEIHQMFDVYNTTDPSDKQIQKLNRLYAQRCIKIRPVFEKFMANIDEASKDLKFALIDTAILLKTRYEPESLRTRRADDFGVRKMWREELNTEAGRTAHTETFKQSQFDPEEENTGVVGRFGPSILLGNVFRESGSFKDSSMFGTELVLLPTVGHSLDRQINNSYGEANATFGLTMPANNILNDRGMPMYEYPALRDFGYAVNPFSITYGSDGITKGRFRQEADFVLRSIDSAHFGLMQLINTMQSHYDSNTREAVKRMERQNSAVEWVETFSRNAANVSAIMGGLVKSLQLITNSLQDRHSLLVPFNNHRAKMGSSVIPRESGRTDTATSIARSRGYLGADGSLVVESVDENVLNGSNSHNEVLSIPYLVPRSGGQSESTNQALARMHGIVLSGVVGDLERAFLVNGELDDPTTGTNMQSGDVHLALNQLIGNGFATSSQIDNLAITLRDNNYVAYTGVHALHSALYQLVVAKGIEQQALLNALQESPELMEILKKTDFNGTGVVFPTAKTDSTTQIDSHFYAVAMVPILTKAFSESTITFRDGKISKTDILSDGQRQEFNALLAEVSDENLGMTPAGGGGNPEYIGRIATFISSLTQEQKVLISEMCSDVNSNMLLDSMISGMQGMAAIELLGNYPAMEGLVPNFKEEMKKRMRHYIQSGAIQWEQGVQSQIANPILRKNLADEKPYKQAILTLLRSDNAHAFGKFLYGIRTLNKFPAYELSRGDTNAQLVSVGDAASTSIRGLFRMSLMTSDYGWSALAKDASGEVSKSMILDAGSSDIIRTHSLADKDALSRNTPKYISARPIANTGMGDALLRPMRYDGVDGFGGGIGAVEGVHTRVIVPRRAAAISKPFVRKMMVDILIREAKKAGTNKISLQPARVATMGRKLVSKGQVTTANKTGLAGPKGLLYDQGIRTIPLLGYTSPLPRLYHGASPSDNAPFKTGEISPYGQKASLGFAFKRLEDGRIVINISGDVLGYKNFTTLSSRGGWDNLSVGVNLEEALGYSVSDKTIAHMDPKYLANGLESVSSNDIHLARMLNVHGGAWRVEILKKAQSILSNGTHESRQVNQRIIGNTSLFTRDAADTIARIAAGQGNPNSSSDIVVAMALMRDSATDNYLTLTLNEGSSQDQIKAAIYSLLMERIGVNRIMTTLGHKRDAGNDFNVFASTISFGVMNDDSYLMRSVMGESGISARGGSDFGSQQPARGSLHGVLETHVRDMSTRDSTNDDTSLRTLGPRGSAEMLMANLPHINADIEKLAAMASGKDSGYFLPDLERQLAMNGDKRSAIEALFPDRPELTEFAWDSSSNSNVVIIPRKEGRKIVGYLVGYDIPSGVDKSSGKPIFSRKTAWVKTMSEAESLRNKFTLSTSKAELAQAIDSLSNQTGKFAIISKDVTKGAYAPVRRNTTVKVSEGDKGSGMFELDYSNGSTYTVGDLELRLSREQAGALQASLSVSDVLQTEIIETRSANMMVGGTGSDPKELESLLRRKINFGTGMGRVEFSSRLMSAVAHGKTRSGKNKYPELMTGAEWYKFIRENNVSKDEIRMSGIAHLLFENKDMQISRSELAEFVFTMYPRNFRQDRGGPLGDQQYLSHMTASNGSDGFPSGAYIYPFIFDAEAKEMQVMDAHVANLQNIQSHLSELRTKGEEGNARANVIESAMKKSIDELVDLAGFPKELLGEDTLDGKLAFIFTQASVSMFDGPQDFVSGSSRRIRPAQMDYLVRSAIDAKMQEVNGIVSSAIEKDIGIVDPWNWAFSHTGSKFDQFELADGTRSKPERRPIIGSPSIADKADRLLIQQGVLISHSGNSHEGMATYKGNYSTSIWLTELWSKRMQAEHTRFVGILEQRKTTATNPEDVRRIQSIIDSAERVKTMRSSFDSERSSAMGNAGHYSSPMTGMFQLGHIRTTAGAMTASHGIHTLGTGIGSVDESDPIVGVRREFEPAFMIEEIQSDTFQYQTMGESVQPEYAMPDTLEQAAGLRDVSIFQGVKREIETLTDSLHGTNQALLNHLNNIKQRVQPVPNGILNHGIQWRVLEATTALERWLLKRDLIDNNFVGSTILTETGGTAKLTPAMAAKYGISEVPTYRWNKDFNLDEEHSRNVSTAISKALFKASAMAFQEICPKTFGVLDLENAGFTSLYTEGNYSENASPTPLLVLLQYAMLDDQAQMSAQELKRALLNHSQPNFDFDAMAERLVIRIEDAVRAWKHGDPSFRRYETGNNSVKIKVLEAYVDTLRELRRSERFTIPNFTCSIENGPTQTQSIISSMVKAPLAFAGGNYVAYHWDAVKGKNSVYNTFTNDFYTARLNPDKFQEKHDQGGTLRYRQTSPLANNGLSQLLMDYMSLFACQADIGDAPKKLAELRVKMDVLSKSMAVNTTDPNASMPHIITSQPYGVEDIYRPISLQGTVLRAANAGFRQIGMTDARHHFVRGHGSDSKGSLILGRRRRAFANTEGELTYPMRAIRMLGDEQYYALHGGLFDRLRKMEDAELKPALLGKKFEHNGLEANLVAHVIHAMMDSKDLVELGGSTEALRVKDMAKAIAEPSYMQNVFGDARQMLGIPNPSDIEKAFSEDGGNALLSEDGKPVAYKKSGTNWWSRSYGTLVSGEKTGIQRLIDTAAANVGQIYVQGEYERGSGYINNYGLPMWYQRMNYAGQETKNLMKTSTDAFERPVIERGEDGMYRILDPKTAKLILQSDNPDMVRETLLQNSKYLGSLPYLSGFLGEWKAVGGYVFSGYGHGIILDHHQIAGGEAGKGMPYTTQPLEQNEEIFDFTFHPTEGQIKDNERSKVFMRTDPNATRVDKVNNAAHTITSRAQKAWRQVPNFAEVMPIKMVTKLIFGLEPTDANVGSALRLMNSNAATMFRFAPNFQTDAQRTAFRQKVISGIPSMMVGGFGDNGMPQANPTLLAWLQNVSANYESAGVVNRALYDFETQEISQEAAAKRHGTDVRVMRNRRAALRKKGIEFPIGKTAQTKKSGAELELGKNNQYRISSEVIRKMKDMSNSGYSSREIARELGMADGTVRNLLKKHRVDYRPDRADPTEPYGGPHA